MAKNQTRVRRPATQATNDEFVKLVKECRRLRLPKIIENLSTEHAQVLIGELIGFAGDNQTPISILTGDLYDGVYDALSGAITAAIGKGCHVRVLTLCDENGVSSQKFFDAVSAGGMVICLGKPIDSMHHFFVSNGAFRLEVDAETRKAYASFNDEFGMFAPRLQEEFDRLWLEHSRGASDSGGSIRTN